MRLELALLALCSLWSPAICSLSNPFYAFISQRLCQKKLLPALWIALLSGLFRDVLLASPKIGTLALSSLISCRLAFEYTRFITVEGLTGWIQVTAILALLDSIISVLLCYTVNPSLVPVLSWKALFLSIVFGCMWTLGLYTICLIRIKRAQRGR